MASVAFGFDAPRNLVILQAFDEGTGATIRSGVLCRQHADAMTPPRGWWIDDHRQATPTLFRESAGRREDINLEAPRLLRRTGGHRSAAVDAAPQALTLFDEPALNETDAQRDLAVPPVHGEPLLAALSAPTVVSATPHDPQMSHGAAPVEPVAAVAMVDADETKGIPWSPIFDQSDDLGGLLNANSPLLARAFGRERSPRHARTRLRPSPA